MNVNGDQWPMWPCLPGRMPHAACVTGEGCRAALQLTLRDYFAAAALTGLVSKIPLHDTDGTLGIGTLDGDEQDDVRGAVARSVYAYADAMLAARSAK